jgi:hypothetical protein
MDFDPRWTDDPRDRDDPDRELSQPSQGASSNLERELTRVTCSLVISICRAARP